MATTIQISEDLMETLKRRKLFDKESYEDVLWDLMEDTQELSEQATKEVNEARAQIKAGKFYTLSQVKKELGLDV